MVVRFRALLAELARTTEEIELLPIEMSRAKACVAWSSARVSAEIDRRVSELSELKPRGLAADLEDAAQEEANSLIFSTIGKLDGELVILRRRLAKLLRLERGFNLMGFNGRAIIAGRGGKKRSRTGGKKNARSAHN